MYCLKYDQSLIPPFNLLICIFILVRVISNQVMIMSWHGWLNLKVSFIPKKSTNISGTFFGLLCACSALHIQLLPTVRINERWKIVYRCPMYRSFSRDVTTF